MRFCALVSIMQKTKYLQWNQHLERWRGYFLNNPRHSYLTHFHNINFTLVILLRQFLQLYTGAKVLVCNTMKCAVKLGKNVVKLNIKIARKFTDPIVETAKDCAHHLFDELEVHVEPSVLNAMDPRDPTEVEENPPRPPAPEPVCEERGKEFVGHLVMLWNSLVLPSNEHIEHFLNMNTMQFLQHLTFATQTKNLLEKYFLMHLMKSW